MIIHLKALDTKWSGEYEAGMICCKCYGTQKGNQVHFQYHYQFCINISLKNTFTCLEKLTIRIKVLSKY